MSRPRPRMAAGPARPPAHRAPGRCAGSPRGACVRCGGSSAATSASPTARVCRQ